MEEVFKLFDEFYTKAKASNDTEAMCKYSELMDLVQDRIIDSKLLDEDFASLERDEAYASGAWSS